MAPWIRVLEAYLVQALLRTPAFHRAVEKVAKRVHQVRHGIPPEGMGGTKLEDPARAGFGKHFIEELKVQLGRAKRQEADGVARTPGVMDNSINARGASDRPEEVQKAEDVWRSMQTKATEVPKPQGTTDAEHADAVWQRVGTSTGGGDRPKQGFLGEYINAIKEQIKNSRNAR